ncbi:sodium:solute symporter family transporter [Tichowtungia aerotolerans]|uniref:Sodium/solute symporter n=1 Tax=Tichowtungia aerotolerans TaxID=2697043 RepID=A0A6P1M9X6_9BACT|nr:sodium/solute symporter [Tichowtungia aerotolerans]QHI69354.1 sodium/solute symporter [Tichowtungia aerotolerans]
MNAINLAVLLAYLTVMVWIGLRFAGRQKTANDFFLAGRNMPWLAVAMSMYASLTSAVTYMGLPGLAYRSNVTLLAVAIVSPLLAPILIFLFYPVYRKLNITTSYEYIGIRFGPVARKTAAALFLLARLGWMATVIYAPAMALSIATGLPLLASILLMGLLATLYTVAGGLAAVLWTDVVQFVMLIGGAIFVAGVLCVKHPDGMSGILSFAHSHDHLQLDGSLSLWRMTLTGVAISFFFQMMQDYGTDQVTVQRLLSTKTKGGMARAIAFNAGVDFCIISLLLFIGLGLFAYYELNPGLLPETISGDKIFPHFIISALPSGISGLLIAAIFAAAMSSMDSGINSMATVVVHDFIGEGKRPVHRARIVTAVLGGLATGLSVMLFFVAKAEGIIKTFATFMGLFSAPVLALFLFGLLTKRGSFKAWLPAAVIGIIFTFWLQRTEVSWIWYFPFGFAATFVQSVLFSSISAGFSPDPRPSGL